MEQKTIDQLNLTPLEKKVLQALIDSLYAEAGFSDVDTRQLAKETGLPLNTTKGVLGSLTKKDIVYVGEDDFADIVYLHHDRWYLHPKWSKEIKENEFKRFVKKEVTKMIFESMTDDDKRKRFHQKTLNTLKRLKEIRGDFEKWAKDEGYL